MGGGIARDGGAEGLADVGVARYAATHTDFSRRAAYRQMIEDFFHDRDAALLPTFGQFNYWIEKDAPAATA